MWNSLIPTLVDGFRVVKFPSPGNENDEAFSSGALMHLTCDTDQRFCHKKVLRMYNRNSDEDVDL